MRRRASSNPVALAAEIEGLSRLGIDELRERWKATYGKTPSLEIGRSFLIRAIPYRLQEWAYGGIKLSIRRKLTESAERNATGRSPKTAQIRRAPSGTILVREWQGDAHRVTVLDDGVSFNGNITGRSPKWRARSPAAAGQDRGSSVYDCLSWRTIMERPKSPSRRCAIYCA